MSRRLSAAACVFLAIFAATAPATGGARDAVIAKVGTRAITAGELQDRIAAMPAFQRRALADSPDALKKVVLEKVLIREALLDQGAAAAHVEDDLAVKQAVARSRAEATLRALRGQAGGPAAVSRADVQAYFEAHRDRFETEERYSVWRILCKTREEAAGVLDAVKKDGQLAKFQELAEAHSIDKATNLRGGNLGFVNEAGASNEAGLRVDPAIVRAAMGVKDGELVAAPVEEAGNWAVVWRRGTVGATHRTADELAPQIRELVFKERVAASQAKLIEALRARDVRDLHEELLQGLEVARDDLLTPRKSP